MKHHPILVLFVMLVTLAPAAQAIALFPCLTGGTWTEDLIVTEDRTVDTCFDAGADNIFGSCDGHTIVYADSYYGFAVNTNGYKNLTIANCTFVVGGFGGSPGLQVQDSENIHFINVTIRSPVLAYYAINISNSDNVTLEDVMVNTSISAFMQDAGTTNTHLKNFSLSGRGARILYRNPITLNGAVDVTGNYGFPDLWILNNRAGVQPGAESFMNTSARIFLFNLSGYSDPIPTWDAGGSFAACPGSVCTEVSYSSPVYIFDVVHFTNFSAMENPPLPGHVPEFSTWAMLVVALGIVVAGIARMRKK